MHTLVKATSLAVAILLPAGLARAQGELSPPAVGWAFDSAQSSARRIGGIPGAAILQTPLPVGFSIGQMAVSRRLESFLAVSAPAGDLVLIRMKPDGPEVIRLDDGLAGQDPAIAISGSGDAAVSYRTSSQRLRIVRDLATLAVDTVDVAVKLCDGVSMSVSDDGEAVAGRCADGSLWLLNRKGEATKAAAPFLLSFVFRPGSREGTALSREGGLYRVLPAGEVLFERPGVAPADRQTAAWAFTGARHDLFAMTDGTVTRLDRQSGELTTHRCGCQPSGLFPTSLGDIVRLNDVSDLPVQLMEVSTGRFWFVPADATGDSN